MTGRQYAERIASYVVKNFASRGLEVYREVPLGKSIIGKDRKVDLLILERGSGRALAVECKYQDTAGTTDEKIPYALDDLVAMRIPACLVYAGDGFSSGIKHMLAASHLAAQCLPSETCEPTDRTRELDHILAMSFGYWDVVVRNRTPFRLPAPPPVTVAPEITAPAVAAPLVAVSPINLAPATHAADGNDGDRS